MTKEFDFRVSIDDLTPDEFDELARSWPDMQDVNSMKAGRAVGYSSASVRIRDLGELASLEALIAKLGIGAVRLRGGLTLVGGDVLRTPIPPHVVRAIKNLDLERVSANVVAPMEGKDEEGA